MKVRVAEVIRADVMGTSGPWLSSMTDNIFSDVDRWEADEHGVLTLYRGSVQVASFLHWINVQQVED